MHPASCGEPYDDTARPDVSPPDEAARFIANVLEASTEYSMIGLDQDGKILVWSSGARRLYGWEPGEVIGKATWDLLHQPDDVAAGKPAEMELQGVFAAARGVADQKELEAQLREQQTYLRGLIESSVDGLVTVDPDGFITDVNEQMCRMSGYARTELVGTAHATDVASGGARSGPAGRRAVAVWFRPATARTRAWRSNGSRPAARRGRSGARSTVTWPGVFCIPGRSN